MAIRVSTLAAFIAIAAFSACTDRDGPAESLGEQVDDTISDVRDRVQGAVDEAGDAVDDALDELEN